MVKTKQKPTSAFAILDAGTSKLAAIIVEPSKTGELNVIGDAIQESAGLRGGEINDLESFSSFTFTFKNSMSSIEYSY